MDFNIHPQIKMKSMNFMARLSRKAAHELESLRSPYHYFQQIGSFEAFLYSLHTNLIGV